MASLNILGIGDEEPGNLLGLSPPLSDGTPRGVQQIPERDALARLYNNVTSMIERPTSPGLLRPSWNPANPVGTERVREESLTNPDLDVVPGVMWGGRMTSPRVAQGLNTAMDIGMGFAGTFGGAAAKTADLDALKWAQTMDKEGKATRQAIWQQTGWFKDPVSGRWLNEISDDAAKYQVERHPVTGEDVWQDFTRPHPDTTLDRLVHHPKLMAAYPEAGRTELSFGQTMPGYGGMAWPPPAPGRAHQQAYPGLDLPRLPMLGHETQHVVQDIERLPRGGNLTDAFHDDALKPYLIEEKNRIVKELMRPESFEKFQESRGRIATPELYEKYVAAKQKPIDWTTPYAQDIWNEAARNVYRRLSGEAQARLTEKRWFMTPEERLARPPWEEYDVPRWRQIVRDPMFSNKKVAAQGSGE